MEPCALAAANGGIWKTTELQRQLADRGLVISAGKMSALVPPRVGSCSSSCTCQARGVPSTWHYTPSSANPAPIRVQRMAEAISQAHGCDTMLVAELARALVNPAVRTRQR